MTDRTRMNLIKPSEAAEILDVKIGTLRAWRSQGVGPRCYRLTPRLIRYDIDEINQWISAHRREPLGN